MDAQGLNAPLPPNKTPSRLGRAALAGLAYVAVVFAAGFALGVLRVTVVTPAVGALTATAMELPLILLISWGASAWIVRRLGLSTSPEGVVMGVCAFGVLMIGEAYFSAAVFKISLDDYIVSLVAPAGAVGLLGQVVFGLTPWLQFAWRRQQP